jgi:hypothetical protein
MPGRPDQAIGIHQTLRRPRARHEHPELLRELYLGTREIDAFTDTAERG